LGRGVELGTTTLRSRIREAPKSIIQEGKVPDSGSQLSPKFGKEFRAGGKSLEGNQVTDFGNQKIEENATK